MNRTRILASLFSAFILAPLATTTLHAEAPLRIQSAQDVVSEWSEDQHLYIKGDVGLSSNQASQLENWLDQNGPHWVVVLVEHSRNELYRAADGQVYREMDAVEHALGHGLSNQTDFGKLVDERTREADGTVLVISLADRNLSYFSSDAQDGRRLGQSNWISDLDQPAVRALRSGMRIRDAVQDTVAMINRRLQQTITKEFADKEAQKVRRREAYQQAMIRLAGLSEQIDEVTTKSEEFKEAFPDAIAELTEPPISRWKDELKVIESQLTEDNVHETSQQTSSLQDRVAEYLNGYAQSNSMEPRSAALETRLTKIASEADGVAAETVAEARRVLEQAATDRAAGRFAFVDSLREAERLAGRGEEEVTAELDRLARQARINSIIRNTATGTGLLAAGGLGVLGFVLNRKRRPVMNQAREFFKERSDSVGQEVEKVYKLLGRSSEVLGSKDRIQDRGYEGTTRELSEKTFDNVNDLIVMSSEVERVMGEAKELIDPANPFSKAINVFSGSRYAQGIERISGKPLEFSRDKGLPLVMDDDSDPSVDSDSNETRADAETAQDEPPVSIRMTFEQVFDKLHNRSGKASETLDQIENGLLQVNDGLDSLQSRLAEIAEEERELSSLAEQHDYFHVPALFETLIPSAQADYDAADGISGSDPVTAVELYLPRGNRKVDDATHIAESLHTAHTKVLPTLRESAPKLEAAGYQTTWMDDRLEEMSARANQLVAQAADRSVADEAETFRQEVDHLAVRAERCLAITAQLETDLQPSVTQLKDSITAARKKLGDRLRLLAGQVLHEKPRDPDDDLAAAEQQLEVTKAALHTGNIEVAAEAVSSLQREVSEGQQAIDDTWSCLEQFDSKLRNRQEESAAARAKLADYEALVDRTRQAYAASTYRLQATDPTFPEEDATINSHIDQCRDQLSEVERLLKLSREFFDKGRILESAAMLEAVAEDVEMVNRRYQDLDEHVRSLEEMVRANRVQLEKLVAEIDRLNKEVTDSRTMRPTMELFQNKVQAVQVVAHEVESQKTARDPIGIAAKIESLSIELQEIDARLEADRKAHAEAKRAVDSVEAQLATGRKLVQRARQDGIPDSRRTGELTSEISAAEVPLAQLQRHLSEPHEDWRRLHEQAVKRHTSLGESAGKLRGELERASSAAESVESSARAVFEATRWTGGWGVRIFGSPGSKELERARAALRSADYDRTAELSRAATIVASHAIQKAQREVARRERDRRRQAERRRRQRSIQIGSGSGGIFGGGRSGGSRRVSSGRSRSRSSGNSGFSRSSW